MIGLLRNVAALTESRELPRCRLAATYASLRARRALGRDPGRARILGWEVAYADYDDLVRLFEEVFVRRAYPFRPRTASPLVVDAGANIGLSTLYFASLAPGARILAFEPEPAAFALLEENVRDNGLANVECFPVALAREPETITLSAPRPASGGASVHFRGPDWSATDVEAQRLSDHLGDERVDFLKLDVEGSEADVLADLTDSGAIARVAEIALECHPGVPGGLAGVLETLAAAGFTTRVSVVGDRLWEPDQLVLVHAFR